MKKQRILTIYYIYKNNKRVPYIRLTGNWLKDLGFTQGRKIKLTLENKKIIIELEKRKR
jgi:hypothetical protein